MEAWRAVALPGGWWNGDVLHRTALVRPLTGRDEEALLARRHATLPERTSALIAHCVGRLGSVEPVTEQHAAELAVGDREALVLALRRATLGDRLQCVVHCPACAEAMDLDLAIPDLLVSPVDAPAPVYDETLHAADGDWRVRFRLPVGADQVAIARGCPEEPARGVRELLARCVQEAIGPDGAAAEPARLPASVVEALGARMAALDPQAEIALDFVCPACGTPGSAILDAADLFFRELDVHGQGLYREVHRLALNYHWSERDILALPNGKRRRYLALLDETVDGLA